MRTNDVSCQFIKRWKRLSGAYGFTAKNSRERFQKSSAGAVMSGNAWHVHI